MGKQFVLGRDIDEALKRSNPLFDKGYTYSYDMLGEAARTRDDAKRYFDDYAAPSSESARPAPDCRTRHRHRRFPSSSPHCIRAMSSAVVSRSSKSSSPALWSWSPCSRTRCRRDHRCRGSRPPGTLSGSVPRRLRARYLPWLGTFRPGRPAYAKRALPVLHYINRLAETQGDAIPLRLVKVPTGTPRSRNPSSSASRVIRSTHARQPPMSPIWCARASCSRMPPEDESSRSSPPITPTPSAPSSRWPTRLTAPSSSSASTAWARHSMPPRSSGSPGNLLPHLRTGGRPQGPAALPGAPPARERRQLVLRPPAGRPQGAGGIFVRAPSGNAASPRQPRQSPDPSATRHLRREASQLPGRQSQYPQPLRPADAGHEAVHGYHLRGTSTTGLRRRHRPGTGA